MGKCGGKCMLRCSAHAPETMFSYPVKCLHEVGFVPYANRAHNGRKWRVYVNYVDVICVGLVLMSKCMLRCSAHAPETMFSYPIMCLCVVKCVMMSILRWVDDEFSPIAGS